MKIKVSEASGPVLDWMVAKAQALEVYIDDGVVCLKGQPFDDNGHYWLPTQNWAQGGPIIEREGISLWNKTNSTTISSMCWNAKSERYVHSGFGPTPLIAAMRCYCVSRLGEIVEVPDELA